MITHYPDRVIAYSQEDVIYIQQSNLDIKGNQIYLFGTKSEVDGVTANQFIININTLMRKSPEPILVHMNLCGGDEDHGWAIYWAIKSCPNHVTILNYASAASMASIIFLAADKRVMLPTSTFMFHEGNMEISGTIKQVLSNVELIDDSMQAMYNVYIDCMTAKGTFKDEPRSKVKRWLTTKMMQKEDVYLDAQATLEYGLADEIFGPDTFDWPRLLKYK